MPIELVCHTVLHSIKRIRFIYENTKCVHSRTYEPQCVLTFGWHDSGPAKSYLVTDPGSADSTSPDTYVQTKRTSKVEVELLELIIGKTVYEEYRLHEKSN